MQCSSCRLAMYCSTRCQHSDWAAGHREECTPMPPEVAARRARGARREKLGMVRAGGTVSQVPWWQET
jgi:hypothetical protein